MRAAAPAASPWWSRPQGRRRCHYHCRRRHPGRQSLAATSQAPSPLVSAAGLGSSVTVLKRSCPGCSAAFGYPSACGTAPLPEVIAAMTAPATALHGLEPIEPVTPPVKNIMRKSIFSFYYKNAFEKTELNKKGT